MVLTEVVLSEMVFEPCRHGKMERCSQEPTMVMSIGVINKQEISFLSTIKAGTNQEITKLNAKFYVFSPPKIPKISKKFD